MKRRIFFIFKCPAPRPKPGHKNATCNGVLTGISLNQRDPLLFYCSKCRRFFEGIRSDDGGFAVYPVDKSSVEFRDMPFIYLEYPDADNHP